MLIKNGVLVLENQCYKGDLRTKGERIDEISSSLSPYYDEEVIDAKGNLVMPGVVDLHTHGSGGYDFMDGDEECVTKASQSLLMTGTTTCLPTSLTSSDDDLFLFFDNIRKAQKEKKGARIPGVHLEGPYFSDSMKGAQDPRYIITPTPDHYKNVMEKGEGLIKRWTIAPEVEGAMECIKYLKKEGVIISGGHTDSDYDTISMAYDNGMSMLTHFYSGMSTIKRVGGFRVLGAVEAGYLIDGLTLELIADGMHLPPELLRLIFKIKDMSKIIACSDSMRGAGMGDGPSILGPKNNGTDVIVEDGIAKMPDRTCFAGSVATGGRLLKTLLLIMHLAPSKAAYLLSLHPSIIIGMDKDIGSIKIGKYADLLILDENANINTVILGGKTVKREEI